LNDENLIPIRTKKQARELGSRGGKAGKGSPNKIFAAKLREMKKRGMTDADTKWFCDRLEDPQTNMFHMENFLEAKKDKVHINQTTVNINMEVSKEETDDLLELLRENR